MYLVNISVNDLEGHLKMDQFDSNSKLYEIDEIEILKSKWHEARTLETIGVFYPNPIDTIYQ